MPRQGGICLIMVPWVGNAHGPDGPALNTQKLRLLVGVSPNHKQETRCTTQKRLGEPVVHFPMSVTESVGR